MTEQQLVIDNYLREILDGGGGDGGRLLRSRLEELQQEQTELREQLKALATPAFDKVSPFVQQPAVEEVEYDDFRGGD